MTNLKHTKRALFGGVIALLVCFTLLLGTTFAWFTDSVTSSGNIIKAGDLNVEMYWADGKFDPAAENTVWTDASTGAIFDYDKWEPGYTEARHIDIINDGNLAFKYQLSIVPNGDVSELADVIDVYITTPAQQVTRADVADMTPVGTLRDMINNPNGLVAGALLPADATATEDTDEVVGNKTFTIVFKMQESAGNDYAGKSIGTDFAIQLKAVQYNYESDSFGKDYDEGLPFPNEDGDMLVEEDGVQYLYRADGSYWLYCVEPEYEGDTVVVAEGVTNVANYAFAYNSNVKNVVLPSTVTSLGRAFDSSSVEKVVLNEGLEQIDSRAFRSTSALKEVVIPSTVKTIADNAFQKSAIQTITIPATVETIGEAAFGASLVETVIIEGNTSIQGYAFRGCKQLRTVYLKGDDVTFIPSTLNGRNSMWFCNGESNNQNTSNITFYVENETVAERVRTAMGAEANNTPIKVWETVSDVDSLVDAIGSGAPVVLDSDIVLNDAISVNDGALVLDGNGHTITVSENASANYNVADCVISATGGTISNLTVNGNPDNTRALGTGSSGDTLLESNLIIDSVVVDKVQYAINGSGATGNETVTVTNSTLYGWISFSNIEQFTFENCTLGMGNSYDGYMVIYGNTTFDNCKFEGVFDLGARLENGSVVGAGSTVTFTNCYYGGVKVTAENFVEYFYYGPGDERDFGNLMREFTIKVDGVTVDNSAYVNA